MQVCVRFWEFDRCLDRIALSVNLDASASRSSYDSTALAALILSLLLLIISLLILRKQRVCSQCSGRTKIQLLNANGAVGVGTNDPKHLYANTLWDLEQSTVCSLCVRPWIPRPVPRPLYRRLVGFFILIFSLGAGVTSAKGWYQFRQYTYPRMIEEEEAARQLKRKKRIAAAKQQFHEEQRGRSLRRQKQLLDAVTSHIPLDDLNESPQALLGTLQAVDFNRPNKKRNRSEIRIEEDRIAGLIKERYKGVVADIVSLKYYRAQPNTLTFIGRLESDISSACIGEINLHSAGRTLTIGAMCLGEMGESVSSVRYARLQWKQLRALQKLLPSPKTKHSFYGLWAVSEASCKRRKRWSNRANWAEHMYIGPTIIAHYSKSNRGESNGYDIYSTRLVNSGVCGAADTGLFGMHRSADCCVSAWRQSKTSTVNVQCKRTSREFHTRRYDDKGWTIRERKDHSWARRLNLCKALKRRTYK